MTQFKLPISYVTNTYNVDNNVINDLELINRDTSLYNKVLNPTTEMGHYTITLWANQYSTNIDYLKDTQALINKELPSLKDDYTYDIAIWNKINGHNDKISEDKNDSKNEEPIGFHEKYNYIEWGYLKHLNNNAVCMQWLSIYNMFSPVLTLAMPILFLILPFAILKMQGTNTVSYTHLTLPTICSV